MSTLYESIHYLCKSKGISGAKMCHDIGVSKSLMTSLKSGRTSTINSKTAQKIADYFGVSVDSLLNTDAEGISLDGADVDGKPEMQLVSEQKKEPAEIGGLQDAGYNRLTPENQKMIDDLIEKLLKSQSHA